MEGKKTIDIDIIVTSRNGDKKNHANYQNNKQTSLDIKEVEPFEPIQMNVSTKVIPIRTFSSSLLHAIITHNYLPFS